MSSVSRKSPRIEELISVEDDTLGSSISISIDENSIRIKERHKAAKENEPPREEQNVKEKWWLKKPETRLELTTPVLTDAKMKQSATPSPDVSSSMKEFLEKEKMCKAMHKNELEQKDRDDTLCDILASAAFDKYPSDFENATDDDIGSILEEMSKIAGAFSPNSGPERSSKSCNTNKNQDEELSVEELLEEAEKLVRKNSTSLSKSASRSDTLVPNDNVSSDEGDSLGKVRQLEADIFQMIEEEMYKESERIKKSPKNEKRSQSPGLELVYENLASLKPPRTLEFQRKKFQEEKVEVSSSSDLDDPIERHSKSEELKATRKTDKENLQKEITDVDKDFFEHLMKRTKERAEGGLSGSSSFGQEDFSHFLRILQSQDKREAEVDPGLSFKRTEMTSGDQDSVNKSPEYPEKEITEILEKELPVNERKSPRASESGKSERSRSLSRPEESTKEPRKSGKREDGSSKSSTDGKKVVNTRHELYTVGLTPRLELFADAIPKMIAEKSTQQQDTAETQRNAAAAATATATAATGTTTASTAATGTTTASTAATGITTAAATANTAATGTTTASTAATGTTTASTAATGIKTASTAATGITTAITAAEKDKEKDMETSRSARRKAIGSLLEIRPAPLRNNNNNELANRNNQKEQSKNGQAGETRKRAELKFCKSKSYDQICKPLRTSLESVRSARAVADLKKPAGNVQGGRSTTLKSKLQANKGMQRTIQPAKPSTLRPRLAVSTSTLSSVGKKSPDSNRMSMAGGDTRLNVPRQSWESLCREERRKNALLRQRLDTEMRQYKSKMESMRVSFEQELFGLKKENIVLKARVDEMSLTEKRTDQQPRRDGRVALLERELEKQERMIRTYETENKKLIQETKRMQEDMKSLQRQRSTALESGKAQQLADKVKDLEEQTLKLNLEVSELKQKNADCMLKNEDLQQQNGLLTDELEMFKDQLRTKNDFIIDKLQAMTGAELELKKQAEELSVKLSTKTEQLRMLKNEYEKIQQNVLPMEKELLELRVKEGTLQEKLQVAKGHVEREKLLSQKLKDQVILDNKKIMDLNRQVREMERILKRKNPDSVSALILTANSEQDRIPNEKVKLLEDRISGLEKELKVKEELAQEKLQDLQRKFTEMKSKYGDQVRELEEKLLEQRSSRTTLNDAFTQTTVNTENKSVLETRRDEKGAEKVGEKDEKKRPQLKSQNSKEDAHLMATIRGLKLELTNKDKAVTKLTKEYQELQKTNRRLQKEREKLLNDRRTGQRMLSSDSKLPRSDDQNSNVYQNGHVAEQNSGMTGRLSSSSQRLYDPMQYTETTDGNLIKRLTDENEILKEELGKMNKDFMALKNKRLHDLNLLQEEHEREMATLLKEYSVKFGESKVVKLQGQINTQVAVITHLKQQIEKLRDYKEQVVVLKAEREHLENKVKTLNEKVKYLSTPGTEQLQLLQDKITILQQRHESREMTLQSLVRDLLRSRTQCRDCKNEKGKNKQLCYFRQELDHILVMLQEIANVH